MIVGIALALDQLQSDTNRKDHIAAIAEAAREYVRIRRAHLDHGPLRALSERWTACKLNLSEIPTGCGTRPHSHGSTEITMGGAARCLGATYGTNPTLGPRVNVEAVRTAHRASHDAETEQ